MTIQTGSVAYVRAVLDELGIKASALAKKAGIATTTLTRALNDPSHKFVLSTSTLSKIADATGISPAPYLAGTDQIELARRTVHPAESFDAEEFGEDGPPLDRSTPFSAITTVIGTVAPGKWRDPTTAAMEHIPLTVTIAGRKPRDLFACGVEGNAAEPVAHDGEFLICRRIPPRQFKEPNWQSTLSGRMVIVERRSAETFQIELTAQFMRLRKNGIELLEFSPDDWRKCLSKTRLIHPTEKKNLRILGLVEYVLRDPIEYYLRKEILSVYR